MHDAAATANGPQMLSQPVNLRPALHCAATLAKINKFRFQKTMKNLQADDSKQSVSFSFVEKCKQRHVHNGCSSQQTDIQTQDSCIDRKQINPVNVCLAGLSGCGLYLQINEL